MPASKQQTQSKSEEMDSPCSLPHVVLSFDHGAEAYNMTDIVEGYASKESPFFQDMLAADAGPLSTAIQARGSYRPSIDQIPFSTYTDREYAAREMIQRGMHSAVCLSQRLVRDGTFPQ